MSITLYDASVPVFTRLLGNLDNWLAKAEAFAAERKFSPDVLATSRLAPDMLPLIFQVTSATDHAKFGCARPTGRTAPSWPDSERTLAELRTRVATGLAYLKEFSPEDFDGADSRIVTVKIGGVDTELTGKAYFFARALPNFYFHVTTAYAILRHNGVALGKTDYLGPVG